jgi:two-component system, NarL family, sensor kinase
MAGASTVWVTLRQDGDRITLTVRDDGVGFDPAVLDRCIADGHIGLASLARRWAGPSTSHRLPVASRERP